jgi:hypothetical protein
MIRSSYTDALRNIPPPGRGCHPALLSVANLGALAGLDGDRIFQDIRESIPPGKRRIPDQEILEAINKALAENRGGTFTPRPRPAPVVNDGAAALRKIINQGKITNEADLWESSPIRLWGEPEKDQVIFLASAFIPDDLIFIGDQIEPGIIDQNIRTRDAWGKFFQSGGKAGPFIIINPINGIPATTKNGDKETLRGDGNVVSFKYCLVEFDNLSREDQIKFWSAAKLPIVALIDSGGKSIHAWLEVSKLASVTTLEHWDKEIKGRLYDVLLRPLGVDSACSNPARLSRLPGHFREEKNKFQRLLWLAPSGRPICL